MAWALTLLVLSAPVRAQQTSAAHPGRDEQAMVVLKRMAEFLTQAPRCSVTVDPRVRRKSHAVKRARSCSAARTVSALSGVVLVVASRGRAPPSGGHSNLPGLWYAQLSPDGL